MVRDDLFTMIHKALRHALFELCIDAGRTDYADDRQLAALRKQWDDFCFALEGHARHEDEYIFELLSQRVPGGCGDLRADHVRVHAQMTLMTRQFEEISSAATSDERRLLGLELYRALLRLTAICLPHFDEEETAVMARIWALCTDREIDVVRSAFMATIAPEEMQYAVGHMVEAADPYELDVLQARMAQASDVA